MSVERSPALLSGIHPHDGQWYTARVRAVYEDGKQSGWSDKLALGNGVEIRNGRQRAKGNNIITNTTFGRGLEPGEEEEDFCG